VSGYIEAFDAAAAGGDLRQIRVAINGRTGPKYATIFLNGACVWMCRDSTRRH
jgi:hypothetical protein